MYDFNLSPEVISTISAHGRDTSIDDLDLSVRAYNCLKRFGVNCLGALMNLSAETILFGIRNMGARSAQEVFSLLGSQGLRTALSLYEDSRARREERDAIVNLADLGLRWIQAKADVEFIDLDENDMYKNLCANVTEYQFYDCTDYSKCVDYKAYIQITMMTLFSNLFGKHMTFEQIADCGNLYHHRICR